MGSVEKMRVLVDLTSSSDEASDEVINVSDDDDDEFEIVDDKDVTDNKPKQAIEDEKPEPMEQDDDDIKIIGEIPAPKFTNMGPPPTQSTSTSTSSAQTTPTATKITDTENRRRMAEKQKEAGNEQYKKKNYRKAVELYTEAINLCEPCMTCALYYSNRAAALIMLCKYRDAISDCRTCLRTRPDFGKAYQREGKCHLALGDIASALRCLEQAKELEPDNTSINIDIQTVHRVQKFETDAERSYKADDFRTVVYCMDRAIEACVSCVKYRLLKAESLAFLGRYQTAQEIANDVLQCDSMNVDAMYIRGVCLYYQDNVDKAYAHFQQVLRLAPEHTKARHVYRKSKILKEKKEEGNTAFKQQKLAQAKALYTEALAIDPLNKVTNSKLYCNRATVNAKLKLLTESIEDCTKAIELDDKYVKAYLRRGRCYLDTEQYDEAVRDYEKAFHLDKTKEHKRLLHDAKFELKKSKRKNYYKILGVGKDASEDEIKKAYRKRALLHHPDRHSGATEQEKKQHEMKFKEIGEAYAVLSDKQKRRRYDTGQDMEDFGGGGGFGGADFDPNTIFQTFFGSGGGFNFGGGGRHDGGESFTFHFG